MSNILGVPMILCHERYLDLPSFVGRNKKVLFQSIVNRVWGKLQGWRNKLLSVGGKEILIKVVVQSILAFSINLFKLPQRLIQDVKKYRVNQCIKSGILFLFGQSIVDNCY
ncbi:hypothetical protein ACOSQ3_009330 [Xanthoceras sorbifolium]